MLLETEQAENAGLIAAIAVERGLPARAATIALATAYQESDLENLESGDRDSLGLFQQRPSQGWGSREQILDPVYATNAFYDELVEIDGYEDMEITEAAQLVQRSAFPEAYADHEADARVLASALTGNSPRAFSCTLDGRRRRERTRSSPATGLTARADAVRRDLGTRFRPSRSAASPRAASPPGTWRAPRTTRAGRSTSSCARSTPTTRSGAGRSRSTSSARPTGSTSATVIFDDRIWTVRARRSGTAGATTTRPRPRATARSSSTATTCTSTCYE